MEKNKSGCGSYYVIAPLIGIIALIMVAWAGCTTERQPCLTPKTASLNLVCMHLPTDTATLFIDTAIPSAVFIALTKTKEVGTIFPLQSNFTLSLSPDTTFCQWRFTTDSTNTKYDTLSFYYQRNLQFLSNACGYAYFYTLDSVRTTHLIIDSLLITNTSVTNNVNTQHLQVYIHPDF